MFQVNDRVVVDNEVEIEKLLGSRGVAGRTGTVRDVARPDGFYEVDVDGFGLVILKADEMTKANPLKRYLLFLGGSFYPQGGWNDFAGSFDGLREAREAAAREARLREDSDGIEAWWHVVDSLTGREVAES